MDANQIARQEELNRVSADLLKMWRESGLSEAFLSAAQAALEEPEEHMFLLDELVESGNFRFLQ